MYCSFITDSFWNNTENKRKTPLKHYFVLTWTNERDKVLNAFHSSKLTSFPTPTFPQREKPHPKSPEPKNPPARSNSALPDTGRFPANARWGEGGGGVEGSNWTAVVQLTTVFLGFRTELFTSYKRFILLRSACYQSTCSWRIQYSTAR